MLKNRRKYIFNLTLDIFLLRFRGSRGSTILECRSIHASIHGTFSSWCYNDRRPGGEVRSYIVLVRRKHFNFLSSFFQSSRKQKYEISKRCNCLRLIRLANPHHFQSSYRKNFNPIIRIAVIR